MTRPGNGLDTAFTESGLAASAACISGTWSGGGSTLVERVLCGGYTEAASGLGTNGGRRCNVAQLGAQVGLDGKTVARKLAALAKDSFQAGVILYDADQTVPLGPKLWAAPLAGLWT